MLRSISFQRAKEAKHLLQSFVDRLPEVSENAFNAVFVSGKFTADYFQQAVFFLEVLAGTAATSAHQILDLGIARAVKANAEEALRVVSDANAMYKFFKAVDLDPYMGEERWEQYT